MTTEPMLAADDAARQDVRRILNRLQGKKEPAALSKLSPCLVTSAQSAEGKSTLASAFATLAARELDLRTLLVDLNWIHPSVHTAFGVSKNYHIADFLDRGPGEYIQKGVDGSLDILTVPRFSKKDRPSGDKSDALASDAVFTGVRDFGGEGSSDSAGSGNGKSGSKSWRLKTMRHIQALQEAYDFVVLDGPAVYPETLGPLDALQLAVAARSTLLVIMMRSTPRETIKRASMALQSQANLIGAVMNQQCNPLAG